MKIDEPRWADSEAGAIQALEAFMAALNSGDNKALFDTMHVPHVRISGNGVAIYTTREDQRRIIYKDSPPEPEIPGTTRSWTGRRRFTAQKTKFTCSYSGPVTIRTVSRWPHIKLVGS